VSGDTNTLSLDWLGLEWTEFVSLSDARTDGSGVYRVRRDNDILYFGESNKLRARLAAHATDARFAGCLVSAHTMRDALPHQPKERETDLIGAYFLATGVPPKFQYAPVKKQKGPR